MLNFRHILIALTLLCTTSPSFASESNKLKLNTIKNMYLFHEKTEGDLGQTIAHFASKSLQKAWETPLSPNAEYDGCLAADVLTDSQDPDWSLFPPKLQLLPNGNVEAVLTNSRITFSLICSKGKCLVDDIFTPNSLKKFLNNGCVTE